MRIKTHVLVVFTSLSLLLLAFTATASARPASGSSLLAVVNATRAHYGLAPLHADTTLARAARAHSSEMLHTGSFSHGAFTRRMQSYHVRGPFVGENLAWGSGGYASPQRIVQEWLASPEHRANLLRPGFTRIGIGTATGTFQGHAGAIVVTADFGGR
jgi:uncharacterized protein YkwD